MTTLEEMARTYAAAFFGEKDDGSWTANEGVMRGLRAVLEKHVVPMLAEAARSNTPYSVDGEKYAARIIAQLTKQNEPAKHEA